MIRNEREYLERRAEDELDCAQHASHPAAVRAHYELLGHYLDRLHGQQASTGANARLSASGQTDL